jgi:hypothetical protein
MNEAAKLIEPKTVSELLDRIERVREDVLKIQRTLEKLKPAEPSTGGPSA